MERLAKKTMEVLNEAKAGDLFDQRKATGILPVVSRTHLARADNVKCVDRTQLRCPYNEIEVGNLVDNKSLSQHCVD